jgi:hypothetical protein
MALDQSQYLHGMAEDENGRPIPKVKVSGMDSNSLQPVDIQSRLASTIQTHTGSTIAPSGNALSSWVDCDGFDKVAINLLNDAAASCSVDFYWSTDGVNNQGYEPTIIPSTVQQYRSGVADVKARYLRVRVNNGDAAPHTFNTWIYLKA